MGGISLEVQWLELCTSTARDMGLIPGWGTKIPQGRWQGQKKKKISYWIYLLEIIENIYWPTWKEKN